MNREKTKIIPFKKCYSYILERNKILKFEFQSFLGFKCNDEEEINLPIIHLGQVEILNTQKLAHSSFEPD